jgi:drug/metabolite transporter (DMT)-like permease
MDNEKNAKAADWLLLSLLSFVWGFSFFFIKKGLIAFSPLQVGALRIFLAFLTLLPVFLFKKITIPRNQLKDIFWVGLFGSGLPPFLYAIAQQKIDSSITGILNSLVPLSTFIIGMIVFKIQFKTNQIIGVFVGLAGALIIVFFKSDGSFQFEFFYALMVILATVCYGINANLIKSAINNIDPISIAVGAFTMMGPIAGIILFQTDFIEVMQTHPQAKMSLINLFLLAFLGTGYALIAFNYLIHRTNALFATMTTYLIPIVAVIVGVFDGESIGFIQIAGMIMILIGIFITNYSFRKRYLKAN